MLELSKEEASIVDSECEAAGIDFPSLQLDNRTRKYAETRHRIMTRLRDESGCSLKRIGFIMKRSHPTILYGIRVGRGLVEKW